LQVDLCHKPPPFFVIACPERPAIAPFVIAPFVIVPISFSFSHTTFVIASPAGAKQSTETLEKIASSGKEGPPRNDMSSLPPDHGFKRLAVRVGEAYLLAILKLDVFCGNALDPFAPQGRSNLLTR
jgi:hypothetical protein